MSGIFSKLFSDLSANLVGLSPDGDYFLQAVHHAVLTYCEFLSGRFDRAAVVDFSFNYFGCALFSPFFVTSSSASRFLSTFLLCPPLGAVSSTQVGRVMGSK